MGAVVKKEIIATTDFVEEKSHSQIPIDVSVIDLSSSDSDYSDDDKSVFSLKRLGFFDDCAGLSDNQKKSRTDDNLGVVLPLGFLDPLPPDEPLPSLPEPVPKPRKLAMQSCRQFWKAGDYEGDQFVKKETFSGGMEHVRVHPRFLHSNATSHKWALGAFAELLDNSLDEVLNGATYVKIDMLANKKDGTRMLLIEDNGGGMDPDKMRQCMSLGYSAKSKMANTIGQYGNGFKTSTMRLGADVIVFSRCRGRDGSPTQSIGMLSYTFLRSTGKEDIVVPMLDYENGGQGWNKLIRSSPIDWIRNVETIVEWSPYSSEADLLHQFNYMKDQGTRIMIYNIWEDDQGELELDFDADPHDIQIRGVNRDEKNIQMAQQFPNSRHFLTYRHSLRSYASILYLRLPPVFKMILRGKEVKHHDIVNDMMLTQEITYRPQPGADGVPKDASMVAIVTIGFVKDAKDHIDVQGFNVYHKNRLIKPFWRLWNSTGSDGRGVIGVLEANFVEPAHDKQGFERTTVLARLETRLIQMQKTYWSSNCHKVGYAPRRNKKFLKESSPVKESLQPETNLPSSSSQHSKRAGSPNRVAARVSRSPDPPYNPDTDRNHSRSNQKQVERRDVLHIASSPMVGASRVNGHASNSPRLNGKKNLEERSEGKTSLSPQSSGRESAHATQFSPQSSPKLNENRPDASRGGSDRIYTRAHSKAAEKSRDTSTNEPVLSESDAYSTRQLEQENRELKGRIKSLEDKLQFEMDKVKSLEAQLLESEQKLEVANREQEALIDIFSEERNRRDNEEETLRKKLKDTSCTIQELLEKQKSASKPE